MQTPAHRIFALIAAATVAAGSAMAGAQNATPSSAPASPPPREAPRPQDIDPAVNTSATDSTQPGRETPRPQDIDPAVDTSATRAPDSPANAPGPSGAAKPGAAQPGTAKPATKGKALDRLELDTTQITGNRELPKVLYIVPWKRSDLGDLVGKPVNSLLDEVLTPVDRDVFKRENRYYRALTPGADEGVGPEYAETAPYGKRVTPRRGASPAAGSAGSATQSPRGSGSSAPPPGNER